MLAENLSFMGHARDRGTINRLSGDTGLHLVFPAGEQAVRRALATATGAFKGMGLDPDAIELAELVLAEVLNNVVEHAYAEHAGGIIELEAWRGTDRLHMRVRDDGVPMPGGALPEGKRHDPKVETRDLPEGGFGWSIIRDLAQDLRYQRDGMRNDISFALDLSEFAKSR